MESCNGSISLVHITPESTDQSQFLMSLIVGQRAVLVCLGCYSKMSHLGIYNNSRGWKSETRLRSPAVHHQALSQLADCSLCAHMAEEDRPALWSLFYKGIHLILRALDPHFHDLSTSQRPYLLLPLHIRVSTYEFVGTKHSDHNSIGVCGLWHNG